jgi:hypothetical protein
MNKMARILLLVALATGAAQNVAMAATSPAGAEYSSSQLPGMELRNRLVTELRMPPRQAARLDAAFADLAPRFIELRSMAAEERRPARRQALAELNTRVVQILTPEQQQQYAVILRDVAANGGIKRQFK